MSIVKSFSFPRGDIRGDMFYIKHSSSNFTVIDCYLPEDRRKQIVEEIQEESKFKDVHRFISTHPDRDHILGFSELSTQWDFMHNFYAVDNSISSDDSEDMDAYVNFRNNYNYKLKEGIKRAYLNMGSDSIGQSGIEILWPNIENGKFKHELSAIHSGKKEEKNGMCPIILYTAHNEAKYIWMGDLNKEMQNAFYDEYKETIPHIDVLFAPHHGRDNDIMPNELLDALNPSIVVIGNAPSQYLQKSYSYYGSERTITQNCAGDITFINEGNHIHIFTENNLDNMPKKLKGVSFSGGSAIHKCYKGSVSVI